LVKASIDGSYIGKLFEDTLFKTGYQQRVEAVVQNLDQSFASDLAVITGITNERECGYI
jgi:hypothetical protein